MRNTRWSKTARVEAATQSARLAQRTFEITKKEQDLGSGSSFQTLSAQHDLAEAQLDLVTATDGLREGQS
jgi:outer membrane protein TolC